MYANRRRQPLRYGQKPFCHKKRCVDAVNMKNLPFSMVFAIWHAQRLSIICRLYSIANFWAKPKCFFTSLNYRFISNKYLSKKKEEKNKQKGRFFFWPIESFEIRRLPKLFRVNYYSESSTQIWTINGLNDNIPTKANKKNIFSVQSPFLHRYGKITKSGPTEWK